MRSTRVEGALARLSEQTGQDFPNLQAARRLTEEKRPGVEAKAKALAHDEDSSIVLFGSWARQELTEHSDDDWLVLVDGVCKGAIRPSDEEVGAILGQDDRRPGKQQIFATHASCDELAENIGLDADDNRNLTRRVLLMLESVPVSGPESYRACWERILDGYLKESIRGERPPRFFLNDVVRYWRTICVDFVGKQRADTLKWGTRNAKLRCSRKLLFAGGLLPILQCFQLGRDETREFLVDQLSAPATDRLAYAFLEWGIPDPGARFFNAYDVWIGLLGVKEIRDELNSISKPEDASKSEAFQLVRDIAKRIDRGLMTLLFDTPLEPISKRYGIF